MPSCDGYHWTWAEFIHNVPTQTLLIIRSLLMSSLDDSQTRKTTKRKKTTATTAKKKMMMTTKTKVTRSQPAFIYSVGEG
jgi:hypothetical protein